MVGTEGAWPKDNEELVLIPAWEVTEAHELGT